MKDSNPKLLQEIADLWINDFKSIQPEDVIRIVSGEAFYKLIKKIENPFIEAAKRVKEINIIAGPIFSCGEGSEINPIIKFAEEGLINLWISQFRQLSHYRIFDRRFLFKEDYHSPLSETRKGTYIYDEFIITKYIYEFQFMIESNLVKKYTNRNMIIEKTDDEINQLKNEYGKNYDFLISLLFNQVQVPKHELS